MSTARKDARGRSPGRKTQATAAGPNTGGSCGCVEETHTDCRLCACFDGRGNTRGFNSRSRYCCSIGTVSGHLLTAWWLMPSSLATAVTDPMEAMTSNFFMLRSCHGNDRCTTASDYLMPYVIEARNKGCDCGGCVQHCITSTPRWRRRNGDTLRKPHRAAGAAV